MQTLINDLLTYARVGDQGRPFVTTDLIAVTREVVSDLEARIEQVNGSVLVGNCRAWKQTLSRCASSCKT